MTKEYAIREKSNPIITKDDLPFRGECVFNSGAVEHDGEIVMILNTWRADFVPQFLVARSKDGVNFNIGDKSIVTPPKEYPYGQYDGIFDTRITRMEEDDCYYITYNTSSHLGGRIRLLKTTDFVEFEDKGFITGVDHRNCVIFPEKVNGMYARLERPAGESGIGDIYISYSPDLRFWGDTQLLLEKGTRYWESKKIGPGAPPVKTEKGWLIIYHGCREHMNGIMYNAGAMLLDLEDPRKIIGKMREYLMIPETDYENIGNVPQVLFPTAAIPHGEKDELKIYYGAADTCIGLARANIPELVDKCLADGPLVYEYKF
ncbi:MAG: glycoside hydrolase family 130 protein [Bacteroidota bacterium]